MTLIRVDSHVCVLVLMFEDIFINKRQYKNGYYVVISL